MYIVDVYPYHSISIYISVICIYRRKFRSQTSDIYGQTEQQRWEESEKRKEEERTSEKRRAEKKKITVREKVENSGNEPSGEMTDEKLHAFVVRSMFSQLKMRKAPHSEHFWKYVEKVHAFVVRSTFRSQNGKTRFLERFWKMELFKNMFGPLLEVEMSKK